MNQTQLDGITKARLVCNLARASGNDPQFDTDADYVTFVTTTVNLESLPDSAADSYATQHADKTIEGLEAELAAALATKVEREAKVAEPADA